MDAIPRDIVDEILLVDDASNDQTVPLAQRLGLRVCVHAQNLGYGANQKTCYKEALRLGADLVVMLHPDYQYDPRLITAMAAMLASGLYDVVLGSRILGGTALKGGMPLYKYGFNRLLTLIQNILTGAKLSEYHTGYRAFAREVLETLPLLGNSDDFVFDNQMLTQAIAFGYRIGEITCPTKYFPKQAPSTSPLPGHGLGAAHEHLSPLEMAAGAAVLPAGRHYNWATTTDGCRRAPKRAEVAVLEYRTVIG